jgi:hypothetical protein
LKNIINIVWERVCNYEVRRINHQVDDQPFWQIDIEVEDGVCDQIQNQVWWHVRDQIEDRISS